MEPRCLGDDGEGYLNDPYEWNDELPKNFDTDGQLADDLSYGEWLAELAGHVAGAASRAWEDKHPGWEPRIRWEEAREIDRVQSEYTDWRM